MGWHIEEIDGHSIEQILEILDKLDSVKEKPSVIIANTIKGKCISYAENVVGYHGVCPKDGVEGAESLNKALADIGCSTYSKEKVDSLLNKAEKYQKEVDKKVDSILPKFKSKYWWNSISDMKVKMEPTRVGFGKAIRELGKDKRVLALGADITNSIKMSEFYKSNPERNASSQWV